MVSSAASTRQPPAGGPKARPDLDDLLMELRQGDREAFGRYFRTFRAPVHGFAWLMLRDERAASRATRDALVGVFRRAILDRGAGDLEVLTYSSALAACDELQDTAGGQKEPGASPWQPTQPSDAPPGDAVAAGAGQQRVRRRGRVEPLRQRFEAALGTLEPRQRAALLLHDLTGLDSVRAASVLGVSGDAAAALLFKARQAFRTALRERDRRGAAGDCRQAEEALVGAVGLGMSGDERSRLRRHAGYCRPCRKLMKSWADAGTGLAVVLVEPPLPQALAATPVFEDPAALPAVVHGPQRALAATGRALRGRAAAWAVAVACLALAAGVLVYGVGVQPLVLMQSVGPAIRLIVTSPPGEEPAAARPAGQTGAQATDAIRVSGAPAVMSAPEAQSGAAGPSRSGTGPAPGATSGGPQTGDRQAVQDGAGAAAAPRSRTAAEAAKAAAKAAKAAAKDGKAATKAAAKDAKAATKAAAKASKPKKPAATTHSSAAAKASSKAAKASAKAARQNARASVKAAGSKSTSKSKSKAKSKAKSSGKSGKNASSGGSKKRG